MFFEYISPENLFKSLNLKDWILLSVGGLGLIWYYFCLICLGMQIGPASPPPPTGAAPTTMRQFMSLSVTTIGSTLATFIGMLIGIKGVDEKTQGAAAAAGEAAAKVQEVVTAASGPGFQWWAAGLYIVSLIVALIFWIRVGDTVDPSISNLGKSLLGLVGGVLAIVLNLPP